MPSPEAAGHWFAPVRIEHDGEVFAVKPHAAEVPQANARRDADPVFDLFWALFPVPVNPEVLPLAVFARAAEIPRERAAEAARAWLRENRPLGRSARKTARK